ncbi:hypothetical protein LTR84_012801 [Exophiala bonariae]|uniref:Ubiquitin-like protease family profile domain-containing protein n=1 Tax=Exophiala bonariae TaxID=1690606 RepID=A0AAV9MTY0_9EURO|nr:hypothetical protein LTR84_012801 [Exophiala bonariae]
MSGEQLDVMIRDIQKDPRRILLLDILGRQLEDLIAEKSPDLHELCETLRAENLVLEEECQVLHAILCVDADAVSKATLNAAVEQLIKDVGAKVLGKRKIREGNSVAINNGVELDSNIFRRLREEDWFDAWTIVAAMQISDKPFFVHHGYSVPLDELGRNERMKPVKRPLAGWAQKIIDFRKKAYEIYGDSTRLVYFCPLNHGNRHFTLLEINEREEVIRHYDSHADQSVIHGTMKLTRVQKLVKEEFGDLKFTFREAPTPQQNDSWSCGVRVVWNFRRLANNLPVGDWNMTLSPERMKMEIVEGFAACIENGAMKRYRE